MPAIPPRRPNGRSQSIAVIRGVQYRSNPCRLAVLLSAVLRKWRWISYAIQNRAVYASKGRAYAASLAISCNVLLTRRASASLPSG